MADEQYPRNPLATAASNEVVPTTPHSPLPWAQSHRECADGFWRTQIYGADGQAIISLDWTPMPEVDGVIGTYRAANAEFIVRACNSYYERSISESGIVALIREMRAYADGERNSAADAADTATSYWADRLASLVGSGQQKKEKEDDEDLSR